MNEVAFVDSYNLILTKNKKKITLTVQANDSNHAQAQAADICRGLHGTGFELTYGVSRQNPLSELFKDLAFNTYTHEKCVKWEGKYSNGLPCVYVFGKRIYVKNLILKYLDIPDDSVIRPTCNDKSCVNPYHFTYLENKNSKLTEGDLKLLKAYKKQGVTVKQIAEVFNVHRATIYRKLKET